EPDHLFLGIDRDHLGFHLVVLPKIHRISFRVSPIRKSAESHEPSQQTLTRQQFSWRRRGRRIGCGYKNRPTSSDRDNERRAFLYARKGSLEVETHGHHALGRRVATPPTRDDPIRPHHDFRGPCSRPEPTGTDVPG